MKYLNKFSNQSYVRWQILVILFFVAMNQCDHQREHASHGDEHASHADHAEEGHESHEEDEHAGHGHGHVERTGAGLAVLEADDSLGVQFNPTALKRIKAVFKPAALFKEAEGRLLLPVTAIVLSRNEAMIYAVVQGRVRPHDVVLVQRDANQVLVQLKRPEQQAKMQSIVIEQADLIHLGYLEAFGASGAGHGH